MMFARRRCVVCDGRSLNAELLGASKVKVMLVEDNVEVRSARVTRSTSDVRPEVEASCGRFSLGPRKEGKITSYYYIISYYVIVILFGLYS